MSKPKISVCLATFNEEKNIKRCLLSVKGLAEEIIVVDGSSIDKTREIAKKMRARVFKTTNKAMFHINKQMALDKARGKWLLLLDADEELTSELKKEIKLIVNQPLVTISGYWIPRKNIIFGKWIKYTGWWPDYQLRLFRRGKAKLPCQTVHEHPELRGRSGRLKNPLVHYNYQNISQFLRRLDVYTDNDKRVYFREKKEFHWQHAISMPLEEFIKRFIVWQGYKDGLHGLVLSLLQAFYQLVVFAKVWQEKGFPQHQPTDIEKKVKRIIKQKQREYSWWLKELKIKEGKSFKRTILKIRKKIGL